MKKLLCVLMMLFALSFAFACGEDKKEDDAKQNENVQEFTVTFVVDGEKTEIKVKNGEKAVKPADPVKEGYVFKGWYVGEAEYQFAAVTADVTVTAKFEEVKSEVKEYTVKFVADEKEEVQTVKEGEKAAKPADPVKEGFVFLGWYLADAAYDFEAVVTNDLELVAKFEEVVKRYTVKFVADGKETVEAVKEGEKAVKPIDPVKEGYNFLGWYVGDETYDFETIVSSDLELVAKFEVIIELVVSVPANTKGYINEEIKLSANVVGVENATITWESTDESVCIVDENGLVKLVGEGACTVVVKYNELFKEVKIEAEKDAVSPKIKNTAGSSRITVNWGEEVDLLKDLEATDNIDGDITSKIVVTSEFDNTKTTVQTVTYEVTDSSGNVGTIKRYYTVKWNYAVEFIGHAGSYYGLMNSEEAFLYAAQVLKYQAIECDLKQTQDGVFVMCHDDTFGDYTLASTNWDTLKDYKITKKRTGGIPSQNGSVVNGTYTTGLCTLERYLEICKEYNCKAVIELKSSKGITNSDQSRMDDLMKVIEDCGMLGNVIFLASQYNCLIWTRQNGYSYIPCQYLVGSCESETYLQRCIDNKLDISINVTGSYTNSEAWLARYKEAGCKISTYTFTQYVDYNVVQEWIDKGADYVTCDWHIMTKLDLPEKEDPNKPTYNVTFKDENGAILKEGTVKEGKTAAAPSAPKKTGYEFVGWDKSLSNITEDTIFTAVYEPVKYTITYDSNLISVEESEFENKAAFVDEFYNDFFDWLKANEPYIDELTVSNGVYTMKKNDKTATFSNAAEIKAIDIYVFEKTLSNYIYKPVERAADGSAVVLPDEGYFLNSSKYIEKYRDLDRYFYEACVNGYPNYDRTFKPLSDGRIQIMFRFQQWQQGTNIAAFNKLPKKYIVVSGGDDSVVLPTGPTTYTILDEFELAPATGSKEFVGWSLDKEGNSMVDKIEKGSNGNIVLYAIWK